MESRRRQYRGDKDFTTVMNCFKQAERHPKSPNTSETFKRVLTHGLFDYNMNLLEILFDSTMISPSFAQLDQETDRETEAASPMEVFATMIPNPNLAVMDR